MVRSKQVKEQVEQITTQDTKQVYGYVRVSTKTQVEKGYGRETQLKAIKDYCKQHGLELVHVFIDGGKSGAQNDKETFKDRPALTDLLASLNGIRKIVVLNTSRLWRDDTAKVIIKRELRQAKADVISIEQASYSLYVNDPADLLLNGMFELLDQYERLYLNLKLAKGRKTKAREGQKACGVAPLGYRWNNTGKKPVVEIDPDTADTVKTIYTMYLQLGSIGKLKNYLDSNGYTSVRGKSFTKQAISVILKNEFYKGIVKHGTVKIQGLHDHIISAVQFGKVQSKLSAGRRNG